MNLSKGIKEYIALSSSNFSVHIVRLFTGMINAKALTPILYATNSFIGIINRYCLYSNLGTQSGLNRQIPIERGKNNFDEIEIFVNSTFWFITLMNLILFIITIIFLVFNIKFSVLLSTDYYLIVFILISAQYYYQFFYSLLVVNSHFFFIAKTKMKFDFVGALLSVAAVYFYKLYGLLILQILLLGTQIFVFRHFLKFIPSMKISTKHLKFLMITGFPILLSGVLVLVLSTMDFLFVAQLFPKRIVGLYGFALTGVAFLSTYINSFSDILAPKIGNKFGENEERYSSLQDFSYKYTVIFIPILAFLSILFIHPLSIAIKIFLKDYYPSIQILKYLVAAAFVNSVLIPCGHIITTIKRQRFYITFIVLSICIEFIGLKYFINSNSSAESVAQIVLIVAIILTSSILIITNFLIINEKPVFYKNMIKLFGVFFLTLATIFADISIANPFNSNFGYMGFEISKLIVFSLILALLLFKSDTDVSQRVKALTLKRI